MGNIFTEFLDDCGLGQQTRSKRSIHERRNDRRRVHVQFGNQLRQRVGEVRIHARQEWALHHGVELAARAVELTIDHYGEDELLRASLFGRVGLVDGDVARMAADVQRTRIRSLLQQLLAIGQRENSVRADIDVDAAAAVLFEIGWAVVRSALEGDSRIPLERALTTLNQIVGLGLLPRSQ